MKDYKFLGTLKTIDKILMPSTILIVSALLLILILTGYDKYSYNQGFYDGINKLCDNEGVLIINEEYVCYNEYVQKDYFIETNNEYTYEVLP